MAINHPYDHILRTIAVPILSRPLDSARTHSADPSVTHCIVESQIVGIFARVQVVSCFFLIGQHIGHPSGSTAYWAAAALPSRLHGIFICLHASNIPVASRGSDRCVSRTLVGECLASPSEWQGVPSLRRDGIRLSRWTESRDSE